MLLIDDLLLWLPLKGVLWVVDQLQQRVGAGGAGAGTQLRKQLLELRLKYEMDEIDEETYEREASDIIQRLRDLSRQESEGEEHDTDA